MKRSSLTKSSVTLDVLSPQNTSKRVELGGFKFAPKQGMVYTVTRGISARVNQNFDAWPVEELRKSYRTFIGRPCFVNHNNQDPSRSRGIILDAAFHDDDADDAYVALLIEVDAQSFPNLAREIETGGIDGVSMGATVDYTTCSICGNEASDPEEFCDHIALYKGAQIEDDYGQLKTVWENCYGINFFEISFVFDPADETALLQNVYSKAASRTAVYSDEMSAPPEVDTYRSEQECPICGADDFQEEHPCSNCGYEAPPEGYGEPDLDAAKREDLRSEEDSHDFFDNSSTNDYREREEGDVDRKLSASLNAFRKQETRTRSLKRRAATEDDDQKTTPVPPTEPDTQDVDDLDDFVEPTEPETQDINDDDVADDNDKKEAMLRAHRAASRRMARRAKNARRARRANIRKRATDEDLKAAEPDERVDVEKPVDNPAPEAEDTQYDASDYDDQGDPGFSDDDETTSEGWADKEKASAIKAARLAETYVAHGLITEAEKWNKMAEFEQESDRIVSDRLELLALVQNKQKAEKRVASRNTVPRLDAPRRVRPSMSQSKVSANEIDKNTLLFIS